MAGERRALLIAADAYTDSALTRLRAPTGDVRSLAAVLAQPAIGAFEVHELINRTTDEIRQEIEGFFDDARREDLLLLYVTGHGVLSQTRRLYFATATTKLKRLRATAIEDRFIHDVMQQSRARSIVLVLDCCHSGAFTHGLVPKSALGIDVERRFEGQGRVILTASTALEYAFEETEAGATISDLGASLPGSLFTRYIVEGLETGDADVDQDGDVSIDELYDYVYERVRERASHQTPGKSGTSHGDIVIAKSPHRPTLRADVRDAIHQALNHPWPAIRETAVGELVRLRDGADSALAAAIDGALQRALDDDSRRVSAAAKTALDSATGERVESEVIDDGKTNPRAATVPAGTTPPERRYGGAQGRRLADIAAIFGAIGRTLTGRRRVSLAAFGVLVLAIAGAALLFPIRDAGRDQAPTRSHGWNPPGSDAQLATNAERLKSVFGSPDVLSRCTSPKRGDPGIPDDVTGAVSCDFTSAWSQQPFTMTAHDYDDGLDEAWERVLATGTDEEEPENPPGRCKAPDDWTLGQVASCSTRYATRLAWSDEVNVGMIGFIEGSADMTEKAVRTYWERSPGVEKFLDPSR